MTVWAEVVTVALLGTNRRTLPVELLRADPRTGGGAEAGPRVGSGPTPASESELPHDPAGLVLDLAARERVRFRTRARPAGEATPELGPRQELPFASAPARVVLDGLLDQPVPELVNQWLGFAVRHGVGVGPEHWTALAGLATRQPGVDRDLLASAYGVSGVWFVGQNPAWSRLARSLVAASPGVLSAGAEPCRTPVTDDDVAENPERVFDVVSPWPPTVTAVALTALGRGQLGGRSERYGRRLGALLPLDQAAMLRGALDYFLAPARLTSPWSARATRQALAACVGSVTARAALAEAFEGVAPELPSLDLPPVHPSGPP
ncbi:MAG: hypothetical protein JWP61_2481 [Friedmanniella sp.]|nr:hypothetical protein [Friedmanniella sp.]